MHKLFTTFIFSLVSLLLIGQTNFIKNAGLENDPVSGENIPYSFTGNIPKAKDLDTWILNVSGNSAGNASISTTEKYKGAQSMQVDLNSIDARYRFYLTNDIKNITAGTYKLSFYAKANKADIPFRVDLVSCTGTNYATEKQLIGSTYDNAGNVVSGREGIVQNTKVGWTTYSYIFTITEADVTNNPLFRIIIRPNCKASGSSGIMNTPVTYWFDDFSLSLKGETDFSFENGIPDQWIVNEGTINVSTDHFKDGKQSLQWTSQGEASLTVNLDRFSMATATSFYLYNPSINNDTLLVEFRDGNTVKKTANILLNFRGWRDFSRTHAEFESSTVVDIDNIVFRRKTKSALAQTLFFDDVKLDTSPNSQRQYGYHMVLDKDYFTTGNATLNLYSNPIDIQLEAVTADDLLGIEKLKAIFKQKPTAGADSKLQEARDYVATLNIVRNTDGSVRGNSINTMAPINKADMVKWAGYVEILAASTLESDKVLFNDFVDYLLDQGIGEGVNFSMVYSDYATVRAVPKGFLSALDLYNDNQKDGVLKLVRWIADYGKLYYPETEYLSNLNADVITNYLGYFYTCALNQESTQVVVRDLKAVTRFLERNIDYVPGTNGILKVDGVGFHHNAHYNNYMYSFRTWISYVYNLKGTPFRINLDAYGRMKKAIVSMYTMATKDIDAERFTANSLSGRNPFMRGGSKIPIYKSEFKKLIEIGGDIIGQQVDKDLAGAYNYFFMSDEYPNVDNNIYEGFYQFNYSPIGVYRQNNWVVTMRSPTTKFWGAEIYSGANRFGRYQSHGTMEIMYDGGLAKSGYPTTAQCGGWDWNVIPGATTVHYTSWKEMMPAKNTAQRFDQYAKTKNFSGALAWGQYGVFGADFDQIDTWGNQHFNPTNLTFRKSVFAFDQMLISLGSDISASGTYSDDMITATNLFQGIKSAESGEFILNGTPVSEGYDEVINSSDNLWMITPQSTGFYIPKGNDAIVIKYGSQTTPLQTGADAENPTTTSVAAKAYLNHGVKTKDHKYYYVAMPDADAQKMQQMIKNYNNMFEIKYHNSIVHALEYKPQNIMAYSIFEPVDTLNLGLVKAATSQMLMMVSHQSDNEEAYFAISNPNHNPVADKKFGWISTPTYAAITLRGQWEVKSADSSVKSVINDDETLVTMTLSEGLPTYFDLQKAHTSGIKTEWESFVQESTGNGYYVYKTENGCDIQFRNVLNYDTQIRIIDIKGRIVSEKRAIEGTLSISVDDITRGIYIIQVVSPEINESVKFVL